MINISIPQCRPYHLLIGSCASNRFLDPLDRFGTTPYNILPSFWIATLEILVLSLANQQLVTGALFMILVYMK